MKITNIETGPPKPPVVTKVTVELTAEEVTTLRDFFGAISGPLDSDLITFYNTLDGKPADVKVPRGLRYTTNALYYAFSKALNGVK